MATEAQFQSRFIKRLQREFPGSIVLKNDAGYQQGILDWTILFGPFWASLDIKARRSASRRPNQDYFVNKMNDMSYAAFVFPENEEEVIAALHTAFAP